MTWQNVKLIMSRELKDQLRDRRTLFTVLVLPLLLYPLMGMALLQVSQFSRQHPTRIWVVGAHHLPTSPALITEGQIESSLLGATAAAPPSLLFENDDEKMLKIVNGFKSSKNYEHGDQFVNEIVQQELSKRQADLALIISEPFDDSAWTDPAVNQESVPKIFVFVNSAKDKSNIAGQRVTKILSNWQHQIAMQVLSDQQLNTAAFNSFVVERSDVADQKWKQAATWSKILPFIVMIWSLTGAFYPAVDLCAGEKERGTFETLLSSPALRSEIAIGKLLTVMTFSMVTSLLNLLSMGFTGIFVVSRMGAQLGASSAAMVPLGMPPLSSVFWLLLALVPIAALFSAVALAAASFAKSSKEGQYYLVPLMMISMPLMMLPMAPAAKLDLGSSLIPVSGLMLMLRGLIEGQYAEVLPFAGLVVAVTLTCCWIAIRWVVIQFTSESVLFRPSERFGVNAWIKQVIRERSELPLVGHAVVCGVVILVIKFFVSLGATAPTSWLDFSKQTVIVLVASVAMPAVLMAMFLTRNPARSLRLRTCRIPVACAAVLTALFLHPAVMWLTNLVLAIYPPAGDLVMIEKIMAAVFADAPGLWAILLVLAVVPAVIEELAFRGFILSGLQSLGSNFKAILISSLLFGIAHSILQQSIITFFLGCLLGFIAVQTKSLIPCILYHVVHNGISTCISMVNEITVSKYPLLKVLLVQADDGGYQYGVLPAVLMTATGIALVVWFWRNGADSSNSDEFPTGDASLRLRLQAFVSRITAK